MQEFLKDILFAVITTAVPVLTAYLVVLICKVGEYAAANTENVKAKSYITEAAEAIAAAVAATNQTYVDALKNAGKFDDKAQKEAAEKALEACLASISPAAQRFIKSVYGDIREYLTTRIEAEVRGQKQQANTIMLGEPFSAELKETPDVTTVAAATAAATAAAVVQKSTYPKEHPAEVTGTPQDVVNARKE